MASPNRPPRSRSSWARRPSGRRGRRWWFGGLLLCVVAVVVAAVLLVGDRGSGSRLGIDGVPLAERLLPGSGSGEGIDPLRYTSSRRADYEARAAAGLAHPLYALSPGGAVATARRVAALRPQVERAAKGSAVDPDVLEAIVYLESGGRPDALASNDLTGAVGLTQILAETGRNLLGMKIDVPASTRLTRRIAKGKKVAARTRLRMRVDERFDAAKSLAATVKYLGIAKDKLGSDELAVVSYHMGIGNVQTALQKFGEGDVPYAQLYFDSSPVHHEEAYAFLASLGDSSSTYLWRIRAAQQIMRQYRADPAALAATAKLQTNKNSGEEVLHPQATTIVFGSGDAIRAARADGSLVELGALRLGADGLRVATAMGELAPAKLREPKRLFRALTPAALATLLYLGAGVQGIAKTRPLTVTSSVRDTQYQQLLVASNLEATRAYSLHTTGTALDLSRAYRTPAQAQAMQFMLDRLSALDLIAWVREPAAIHVTVGPRGRDLLGLLKPGAPVAVPVAAAR